MTVMAPPATAPIFIVGAPRSGTTLLRSILNRHPAIGLCDETYYFYYVYHRRRAFGDLAVESNRRRVVDRYLETHRIRRLGLEEEPLREALLEQGRDYASLFLALLAFYARSQGKTRCGEKTPQHAFETEHLRRMYPDARLLHLVRDPRDVVASLQRMPWASQRPGVNARLWRSCVAAAERAAAGAGFLRVSYESLVESPAQEVERICEFLGEAFDPAMLEASGGRADRWWFQRAQEPVRRDRRERWREELREEQVAAVESIAGPWMDTLGYARSATPSTALRGAAARLGDALEQGLHRMRQGPALWYRWFQPTRLAAEEARIDRLADRPESREGTP